MFHSDSKITNIFNKRYLQRQLKITSYAKKTVMLKNF